MYTTKDKDGNSFYWGKKGKNKECWIKEKSCITKKCFVPKDCGSVDEKTQRRHVLGMCNTYYQGECPMGYDKSDRSPLDL